MIYNNPTEDTVKKYYKDIKNIENTSDYRAKFKYRIDAICSQSNKDIPNDCF